MTRRYYLESLTEDDLRAIGIEDAPKALRFLRDLAGQGVTDDDLAPLLPLLLDALRAAPDPDRALHSFSRWFAAVGGRYAHLQLLLRHPIALDLFCLVTGSSQYFADLLIRQPELFEIIANPGVRGGTKTAATLYRDLSALSDACRRPELKRDALRRWKAREMLRIGVRDLVGLSDMPATAREFSNLADACVQKALDIALAIHPAAPDIPAPPFAILAMGKLGGQELNYSSDIDLMFVHGDSLPSQIALADGRKIETTTYVTRLAETVVKTLAEESANGHVFRVDMRLRPEGRFGPLTRSLSGFRAYYESWAESWERQALLKVRPIAGDRALGEAFMQIVTPFVYRRNVSAAFLDDIRENKRRIEQKCALEDQTFTNVKTGYGGIRDVEFIVQKLQLEWGGTRPRLRTPNTLAAIQRLHHAGFLRTAEAHELAEDYQFLRTLEHRLQLLHGFQTQTLPAPTDARERLRLARRMGFTEAAAFEDALSRHRERVHDALERLFYAAPADSVASAETLGAWADLDALLDNLDSPVACQRLEERLRAAGFRDISNALRALRLPMHGNEFGGMPPDTPVEFKAIAPRLFALLARSPDPDAGLAGIETLALAVPNRAQLYAAFDDSPEVMRRLVLLSASAPPLVKLLARHLEWMETLVSPEEEENSVFPDALATVAPDETQLREEAEPTPNTQHPTPNTQHLIPNTLYPDVERLRADFAERAQGGKDRKAKLEAIARVFLRERLRIGARDVWDEDQPPDTMTQLSALADATLQTLLDLCIEPLVAAHADPDFARRVLSRVAVVGLGKLGGMELGYGSDWDVVFVYDEEGSRADGRGNERFALVNALVERVLAASKDLIAQGAQIEIDLRLRPWGRKGALIYSLRGFIDYYRTSCETWERQAALKARFVAGDVVIGRRFERILRAVSYGRGVTAEEDTAVQAMKQRIETERLKPAERHLDLKLGHGGLTDIEWLAQRLQLRFGPTHPEIRLPNTLRALSALASARLLDNAEADVLSATYSLLTRLRNAMWLQTGSSQDVFPADPLRRRALARLLGYGDDAQEPAETRLWEDAQAYMQEARRIFVQRFYADDKSVSSL